MLCVCEVEGKLASVNSTRIRNERRVVSGVTRICRVKEGDMVGIALLNDEYIYSFLDIYKNKDLFFIKFFNKCSSNPLGNL